MGCKCLEIHIDLEVRSLANPLCYCPRSGKAKILPRYMGGGVCVRFLMSLLKELPTLALPLVTQLLLVAPQAKWVSFLPRLCEGVRSDAGGKGRAAWGRAARCTEQTDPSPAGTLRLAVNSGVNFRLPWSCPTQTTPNAGARRALSGWRRLD